MHKLGMEEGIPIESRLITKRIESAQRTVEAQNFESRKTWTDRSGDLRVAPTNPGFRERRFL